MKRRLRNGIGLPRKLDPADLDRVTLSSGSSSRRGWSLCLFELVSWLAGQKHTFRTQGVNKNIRSRLVRINDTAGHDERQRLKEIAPLLVGFDPDQQLISATLKTMGLISGSDLTTVDQAITFVKLAVSLPDLPEPVFTPEDEQFLQDVEFGKVESRIKTAMVAALIIAGVETMLLGSGLF